MARARLDHLVVASQLAASRERARALILAGHVLVDGVPVTKAGTSVDTDRHDGIKETLASSGKKFSVTEVVGTSPEGIETAIRNAVGRASETIRNLDWFEVTEVRGQIEGSQVAHWQVGLKIGFRLEGD